MGISSADRGISTVLNLFSLLSLPLAPDELDRDMSKINRQIQELVPKLFSHYERESPPIPSNGGPVEIVSYLMVDHIEDMNEFQQSITFHGTLILNWLDERLAWEPRDFGQLDKLSFTGFDLSRFWSPGVTVKGLTMPSKELAMFHNTAYTLTYQGYIFAEMSISIKAACRLDLTNYPNDNQTCFVMVFTPIYQTARHF
ncbi:unnamed protein product [Meloidogyne enterolobii]|uniref:Neurotransmitter-gated ion-channel ligand-binding domain-containing protein n=2 Tax=Meloidogyne enterolobii TaxID=390850 RepID=A0A6V7VG08_MELEN|nr:unnamed protein product [Meloidogyne enterolobii]